MRRVRGKDGGGEDRSVEVRRPLLRKSKDEDARYNVIWLLD